MTTISSPALRRSEKNSAQGFAEGYAEGHTQGFTERCAKGFAITLLILLASHCGQPIETASQTQAIRDSSLLIGNIEVKGDDGKPKGLVPIACQPGEVIDAEDLNAKAEGRCFAAFVDKDGKALLLNLSSPKTINKIAQKDVDQARFTWDPVHIGAKAILTVFTLPVGIYTHSYIKNVILPKPYLNLLAEGKPGKTIPVLGSIAVTAGALLAQYAVVDTIRPDRHEKNKLTLQQKLKLQDAVGLLFDSENPDTPKSMKDAFRVEDGIPLAALKLVADAYDKIELHPNLRPQTQQDTSSDETKTVDTDSIGAE